MCLAKAPLRKGHLKRDLKDEYTLSVRGCSGGSGRGDSMDEGLRCARGWLTVHVGPQAFLGDLDSHCKSIRKSLE